MRLTRFAITAAICSLPAGLIPGCSSAAPAESVGQSGDTNALASIVQHPTRDACGPVPTGQMRCHAKIRMDITNNAAPQGFGPSDLASAYNLPSSGGAGQTVAIVDAQDDPTAEADLAVYRQQYGLPPCTTANGCFKKVNQNGQQGSYPTADAGWAGEISLDLDMVSAICPSCKIILVEANSATTTDLGAGVQAAASLGANAISNSYGGGEDSSNEGSSAEYYNQPGILVTASAGDNGYGAEFPASSEYVLGVGGTSLVNSPGTSRGWTEGAWNGTGSGCSASIGKPSFQSDTGCNMRTVADVSAVADPNTGVAVYVTYGGGGGWNVFGGTSAASPIIAATYALVGKANQPNSFAYANTTAFNDITTGSNGSCSPAYLCTAGVGYDGPTGWGTPNGQALATASNTAPPVVPGDAGAGGADGGEGNGNGGQASGSDTGGGAQDGSSATGGGSSTGGAQDGSSATGGGAQDGNSATGGGAQDGASTGGAQDGSGAQDGAGCGCPTGGSQDGTGATTATGTEGTVATTATGTEGTVATTATGTQDGYATTATATTNVRRGGRKAPAWSRLGSIVSDAVSGD
jgi:hypothetical protein